MDGGRGDSRTVCILHTARSLYDGDDVDLSVIYIDEFAVVQIFFFIFLRVTNLDLQLARRHPPIRSLTNN